MFIPSSKYGSDLSRGPLALKQQRLFMTLALTWVNLRTFFIFIQILLSLKCKITPWCYLTCYSLQTELRKAVCRENVSRRKTPRCGHDVVERPAVNCWKTWWMNGWTGVPCTSTTTSRIFYYIWSWVPILSRQLPASQARRQSNIILRRQ